MEVDGGGLLWKQELQVALEAWKANPQANKPLWGFLVLFTQANPADAPAVQFLLDAWASNLNAEQRRTLAGQIAELKPPEQAQQAPQSVALRDAALEARKVDEEAWIQDWRAQYKASQDFGTRLLDEALSHHRAMCGARAGKSLADPEKLQRSYENRLRAQKAAFERVDLTRPPREAPMSEYLARADLLAKLGEKS